MLLYDRIRERAERVLTKRPDKFDKVNRDRLRAFDILPVYEVSSIVTLFDDWHREKKKKIPRNPPHDMMWVEYRLVTKEEGSPLSLDMTIGAVLQKMDALDASACGEDIQEIVRGAESCWYSQSFRCVNKVHGVTTGKEAGLKQLYGKPTAEVDYNYWVLKDGGTSLGGLYLSDSQKFKHPMAQRSDIVIDGERLVLGCPVLTSIRGTEGSVDRNWTPWPMWMAFALLHCRNVKTEEVIPDATIQRRCLQHGAPLRVSHRVLKIEVPQSSASRGNVPLGTGKTPRGNICPGHFKHLTHERFTEKKGQWVWWNAHWRGDKDDPAPSPVRRLVPSPEGHTDGEES